MAKRSKDQEDADKFRASVERLRLLGEIFRDWEADWLDSEARRPAGYVFSEKERVILNQIKAVAHTFEGYSGYSVTELINMVYRYRADLDHEGEKFVERLKNEGARTLPVRQLVYLVTLARVSESIPKDELVEEALAETYTRDAELFEPPDFIPYQRVS
ncbi:MAG: hypothetical protein AB7O50_00820 [Pseudolabrys sp.]